VSSKKITLSIKNLEILGVVVFSAFLLFFGYIFIAGQPVAEENQIENMSQTIASPTPFSPEDGEFSFEEHLQNFSTVTPRPTVVYEDGSYPTATPLPLPTLSNITPYTLPDGINPLTGLPPAALNLLDRRPIASKIALYPRYIRPVSGMMLADVVFEYYIEGGLTRFIAVFYGNDAEKVGPVRSGRFFDEHIAHMYQSYLVFKYADKRVFNHLKETDLRDFLIVPGNSACPPFVIGKQDRDTYNNIFFNTTKFADCLAQQNKDNSPPNLRAGYFSTTQPFAAEPALDIFTRYSLDDYHYWKYNPYAHKYYRYQESDNLRNEKSPNYAPLIDALITQQVSADNIVFLFVPYTFADQFQEEDEVYHIDLIGSGKGYLARDGNMFPLYWRRIAIDQPLLLTDPNGMPLSLKQGNTFYEVLGESSQFMQQEAQWYFQFETP